MAKNLKGSFGISDADVEDGSGEEEFPIVAGVEELRDRPIFGVPQGKFGIVGEIPGYKLQIMNDMPGQLDYAIHCGFEFVKKGEVGILPGVVSKDTDLGEKISYVVNPKTDGMKAYLMKIRKEYWDRAQAEIQKGPDQVEAQIRMGRAGGTEDHEFYLNKDVPIKLKHVRR